MQPGTRDRGTTHLSLDPPICAGGAPVWTRQAAPRPGSGPTGHHPTGPSAPRRGRTGPAARPTAPPPDDPPNAPRSPLPWIRLSPDRHVHSTRWTGTTAPAPFRMHWGTRRRSPSVPAPRGACLARSARGAVRGLRLPPRDPQADDALTDPPFPRTADRRVEHRQLRYAQGEIKRDEYLRMRAPILARRSAPRTSRLPHPRGMRRIRTTFSPLSASPSPVSAIPAAAARNPGTR